MAFVDKLYLASQSPRRRDLLRNLFKNFELLAPKFSEPRPKARELSIDYLARCVNEKWQKSRSQLQKNNNLLLVADTIVVLDKMILGKPQNSQEALSMLQLLSGREHLVLTAFILERSSLPNPIAQIEKSRVAFYPLQKKQIKEYVLSGEPLDKAGSYGFQGRALSFIRSVRGSYTNIVGLPVEALREKALSLGLIEEGS